MKQVNSLELLLALVCLLFYIALWPLSLCVIARLSGLKEHFLDNYLIGSTEHFFNGITPFSTGGQPIQVYLYTKCGVSAAQSTGIILTNFVAFMISTNIIALISLVFYGRFSQNFTSATSWMIILGFVMNLFTLCFMILMATSKKLRSLLKKLLMSLCKIKLLSKFLNKLVPVFDQYCLNAQTACQEIFKNVKGFVLAIILRSISLLFYYAIPFFIIRSLGVSLSWDVLPYMILASAFAITTMVWMPTPGGTGGIEFAFLTIFTSFVGVTQVVGSAGTVVWRGLTYYLLMLISFIQYLIFGIITKKKKEEVFINDSCTTNR